MGFSYRKSFGERFLDFWRRLLQSIGLGSRTELKTEEKRLKGLDRALKTPNEPDSPPPSDPEMLIKAFQSKETIMMLRGSKVEAHAYQIEKYAIQHDLGIALVAAVCMVESAGNTWAMRYEGHWRHFLTPDVFARRILSSVETERIAQATSFGLMQVMGAVARELGHTGWLSELCEPAIGLDLGCKKLKQCLVRHGFEGGVAAYNAGTPRINAEGRFVNQQYVDKVLEYQKQFLEITQPMS